jgi:glycosyltransferase involved in cell wall biosynthesis
MDTFETIFNGQNSVDMPRITIIVPTYNRSYFLRPLFASLLKQTLAPSAYEVLIVDNNSTDDTRAVTFELMQQAQFSGTYIFEPHQGLHNARNRGILEARGDIVVFADEDIITSEAWLENILSSFDQNPRVGIVGGPVYPIWDSSPPEWIYDYGTKDIHCVFAYLNYGNESKFLEREDIFGCNFAIKKQLAVEINGSAPDTFPPQMIHYSGTGEYAMLAGARQKGYKVYYNAEAYVRHHAPVSRCTLKYFINRYQRWGVESIYQQYNSSSSLPQVFISLCQRSITLISSLLYNAAIRKKVNTKYYLVIMLNHIIFSWKHFMKLIFDADLRTYSKRTDYLSELDKNHRQ